MTKALRVSEGVCTGRGPDAAMAESLRDNSNQEKVLQGEVKGVGAEDLRISVICIGNEYQLDDGFGPAVARYLQSECSLPDNVHVLDRAVMGYGIAPDLMDCDVAVVVDALDGTGGEPGTVYEFEPDDMAAAQGMTSLHDIRFANVLEAARFMGATCKGHCFGVQVQDMGEGTLQKGLTPAVAAAVPLCAQAVLNYINIL